MCSTTVLQQMFLVNGSREIQFLQMVMFRLYATLFYFCCWLRLRLIEWRNWSTGPGVAPRAGDAALRIREVPALVIWSHEAAREVMKTRDTAPTVRVLTNGSGDIIFVAEWCRQPVAV